MLELGVLYDSIIEIEFGEPFPEVGLEQEVTNKQDIFKIKYSYVGTPYWTGKLKVEVPIKIMIIEIIELSGLSKAEQLGFTVYTNK